MFFRPTSLADAVLVELDLKGDARGFFARTFCEEEFAQAGLPMRFVQHSLSRTEPKGAIRGMHFQRAPHEEGKLVRCVRGAIWDVIIDLRPASPTYRKWEGFHLDAENKRQLYVPPGFAHGFQTMAEGSEVFYLISAFYAPESQAGVRWNDPAFGIEWPMAPTLLSDKDRTLPDYQPVA